MKKSVKIALVIIAALIVLGVSGFFVLKNIIVKETGPNEPNVTSFKCHIGKTITDSDLDDIKEAITKAIGDKVLKIEKGDIPLANTKYITDENGEDVDAGDVVYVILSVLDTSERGKLLTVIKEKYDLDKSYFNDLYELKDVSSSYYDNINK